MFNQIDIFKSQSRALRAFLELHEGFALKHGHCLNAIAAVFGYGNWNVACAAFRAVPANQEAHLKSHSGLDGQVARLTNHLAINHGFSLRDGVGAIAAIRRGELAEQASQLFVGRLAVANWLQQPHPELGRRPPQDVVETEDGHIRVQHLLEQMAHGVAA